MGIVEELFLEVPTITRAMCVTSFLLTVLTYLELVEPYNLYFNVNLIIRNF